MVGLQSFFYQIYRQEYRTKTQTRVISFLRLFVKIMRNQSYLNFELSFSSFAFYFLALSLPEAVEDQE